MIINVGNKSIKPLHNFLILLRPVTLLIVLLAMFFFFSCSKSYSRKIAPKAVDGTIDLRNWDLIHDGPVKLNGEWQFCWNEFLYLENLQREDIKKRLKNIEVPGTWNSLGHEGKGYATYRLRVLVPEKTIPLSLKIPTIASASEVYFNEKKVFSTGRIGKTVESFEPGYSPTIINLDDNENEIINIIIHVSNFNYRKGGLWIPLTFGETKSIYKLRERNYSYALFLFGTLLIMGFYHFGLYIMRKKDQSPLFFGLFCFLISIRILVTDEHLINKIFPGISYELVLKLEFLTVYMGPAIFCIFLYLLFSKFFHEWVVKFCIYFSSLYSLIVIIFPNEIFNYTLFSYQIYILFFGIYCIIVLIRSIIDKQQGSIIFLTGSIILFLANLNDILYYNNIIHTVTLVPFGLFILIFSQSFLLSMRFSNAFLSIENMSKELKDKNLELTKFDKLKDEFLANTSQELKLPLIGIIGIAESLIDNEKEKINEPVKKNLEMIAQSGHRLSSLIHDILDFSKLKSMGLQLHIDAVDIRDIVQSVFNLLGQLSLEKGIELKNNIPNDFPQINGDKNRIQQILYNLVGNAMKFTDEGNISISADIVQYVNMDSPMAEISVTDTGIGIPEEKLDRIFISFEQADGSTEREYGGTGLGLAITKSLVELHNGEMKVESKIGVGSCFSFTINFAEKVEFPQEVIRRIAEVNLVNLDNYEKLEKKDLQEGRGVQSSTEDLKLSHIGKSPDGVDSNSVDIMIVDDDPVNLQVIINIIKVEGFSFVTALSGDEALKILKKTRPDIILLDIMMPGLNGFDTAKEIRKNYSYDDVPIIFITAKNMISDLVDGYMSGANDYISKPFSKMELLTRLKFHVSFKKAIVESKKLLYIEKELEVAKRIQLGTIPSTLPQLPNIDIATTYIPMTAVGGDFYDYFVFDDNRISFLLTDVSGHGVPAALIASMIKIVSNTQRELSKDPSEFLFNMNQILTGNIETKFLTASCIYLDMDKMKLDYANAGHLPLIIQKNNGSINEYRPPGKLIGVYKDLKFTKERIDLNPGDRIIIYTDGITEAIRHDADYSKLDIGKDMFGSDNLMETLNEGKHLNASDFSTFLMDKIKKWSGRENDFEDDLTFLVIDIK